MFESFNGPCGTAADEPHQDLMTADGFIFVNKHKTRDKTQPERWMHSAM
jgi:hypothetical protein